MTKIKIIFEKGYVFLKDLVPFILTIVAVLIAYQMNVITKNQNDISNRYATEAAQRELRTQKIIEGQLVASLIPIIVHGTEKEKKIAITLIDTFSLKFSNIVLPIIIKKDANENIIEFANQTFNNSNFREAIKNALITESILKYKVSAEYFKTAAQYADTSRYNSNKIQAAIILYEKGQYVQSINKFKELFNLN